MPMFDFGQGSSYDPFPVQDFRSNSFADMMNMPDITSQFRDTMNLFSQAPAQQTYMHYLQNVPQMSDYKPGFWRGLLATIGGVGTALGGHPEQASGIMETVARQPYATAMEQFSRNAGALGQAANVEEGQQKMASSMFPDLLKNILSAREFGVTARQNQQKINQEGQQIANTAKYQGMEAANAAERNRLQAEQNRIDEAYKNGQISIGQRNAATNELNAQSERSLRDAQSKYYLGQGRQTSANHPEFNAALQNTKLKAEILGDPILSRYADDITRIANDPEALQRYNEIVRKLGLVSGTYIPPPKQPSWIERMFGGGESQ